MQLQVLTAADSVHGKRGCFLLNFRPELSFVLVCTPKCPLLSDRRSITKMPTGDQRTLLFTKERASGRAVRNLAVRKKRAVCSRTTAKSPRASEEKAERRQKTTKRPAGLLGDHRPRGRRMSREKRPSFAHHSPALPPAGWSNWSSFVRNKWLE